MTANTVHHMNNGAHLTLLRFQRLKSEALVSVFLHCRRHLGCPQLLKLGMRISYLKRNMFQKKSVFFIGIMKWSDLSNGDIFMQKNIFNAEHQIKESPKSQREIDFENWFFHGNANRCTHQWKNFFWSVAIGPNNSSYSPSFLHFKWKLKLDLINVGLGTYLKFAPKLIVLHVLGLCIAV